LKLTQKMSPFVGQLSTRCAQSDVITPRTELASIECVAATLCLVGDHSQVDIDRDPWRAVGTKTMQLRMMTVSAGRALEHSAREEGFSPKRDQTLSIKVLGMKCPKTQGVTWDDGRMVAR